MLERDKEALDYLRDLIDNGSEGELRVTTAKTQDEVDTMVREAMTVGLFTEVERHKGHWHLTAKYH